MIVISAARAPSTIAAISSRHAGILHGQGIALQTRTKRGALRAPWPPQPRWHSSFLHPALLNFCSRDGIARSSMMHADGSTTGSIDSFM